MKNSYQHFSASVIMPRLDIMKTIDNPIYKNDLLELVDKGIAGFCIFNGNPAQVSQIISELQGRASQLLLFSADFEHGLPMRLEDGTSFPHAMALGKNSGDLVKQVASSIAYESKMIGVNWNLAPVCDINSNPQNPIINIRAFGGTFLEVEKSITEYIQGTQSMQVLACAKHFPGHGDVAIDSHLALPLLDKSLNKLENNELRPFISAIRTEVKSIMLGHLVVPALSNSNLPVSISADAIKYLREVLKFQGIIVTDALDMNSITDNYNESFTYISAIEAGVNLLLLPPNPQNAINIIEAKANSDKNLVSKLEASKEILDDARRWLSKGGKKEPMKGSFSFPEHEKLALKAAYHSLNIIGDNSTLPISDDVALAGFAVNQGEDIEPGVTFFKMLSQAIRNECDFGFIDENISFEDIQSLKSGISDARILVFAIFYRARAYSGSIDLPQKIKDAMNLLADGRPKIVILFGNPYIASTLQADCIINAFSDSLPSIASVVMKLSGRILNEGLY